MQLARVPNKAGPDPGCWVPGSPELRVVLSLCRGRGKALGPDSLWARREGGCCQGEGEWGKAEVGRQQTKERGRGLARRQEAGGPERQPVFNLSWEGLAALLFSGY